MFTISERNHMLHFHIKFLEYLNLNHSKLALDISIENCLNSQVSNMWSLKKQNKQIRNRLIDTESILTVARGEGKWGIGWKR